MGAKMNIKDEVTDKYSLRGRVYSKIRADILEGRYKNNDELRELAIGEELGVSRTPVREAFRQLELEGLIRIVPNKGAYVTGITAKDVKDIYMIRSKLEGLAARWAVDNITNEQMEEMEENIYLSEFHGAKGHSDQIAELDNRFHEILYEACNSKLLENQLREYPEYVQRVRRKTLSENHRSLASTNEHRKIMEAIKSGDKDLAEETATNHIKNAYSNIVANGLKESYPEE